MLFVGYAVTQVWEFFLGIWFLYRIYPETRFNGKYYKYLLLIFCAILCGISVWNAYDSFISNTSIILHGIVLTIFYCISYKAKYKVVILWELFYATSVALLKLPYIIFVGIIRHMTLFQINRGARTWGDFIWCFLIDVVFLWFIKGSEQTLRLLESLVVCHKKMLIFVEVLLWCLLSYNMWLGKYGFHAVDLVLALIFIVSSMFFMQYLVLRITYQELSAENDTLDAVQNVLQKQNYALQELYNQNNRRMHDLKHHMLYLLGCLENKRIDEAEGFLLNYTKTLKVTEHKMWTGFSFLDFMLDYKKQEMDEKRIILELEVGLYEYPMEEAELGVILGNLLDNAIEAAADCEEGRRYIQLKLCTVNCMFFLRISNSSIRIPEVKNGKFETSKNDSSMHGLGIENVKRIVKKYDGTIDFRYDDEYFEIDILI